MDAKISVTTRCNARCKTCPVWQYKGADMPVEIFAEVWQTLMMEPRVDRILLNNTGDMYIHPERAALWEIVESHAYKPVIVTTNAAAMDYVPRVAEFIISFNGYDSESYEYTTGLPFQSTVERIHRFYDDLRNHAGLAQIHTLAWGKIYVDDIEDRVRELWSDFPGRVRVSYKVENQQERDVPGAEGRSVANRIPCDYLQKLNIWPDGSLIMCAHDFKGEVRFGNILEDTVFGTMMNPLRMQKVAEHRAGVYTGLCKDCNYNTPEEGRIVYVKE